MKTIKKLFFFFLMCLSISPIYAMKLEPATLAMAVNPPDQILKQALKSEIYKISHFYASASDNALRDLIDLAKNALREKQIVSLYSAEFRKTNTEIEKALEKIIRKAKRRLKFNAAKDLRCLTQNQVSQSPSQALAKKQASKRYAPIPTDCFFYVMLDVPNLNSSGKSIDWKGVMDSITSQMKDAEFIPEDYRHISLVRNKFKQPLAQDIRTKIERALSRANTELKSLYPDGIKNIALLDGALILGENAVAFGVARNMGLIKIVETILASFSSEGLTGFEFYGFKEESPLHITLGRIIPEKKVYDLRGQIQKLHAPSGARDSQGENFVSDLFRASCSPRGGYLSLGNYKF